MSIENIENEENGLSVREKLNATIVEANKVENKIDSSKLNGGTENQILTKNSDIDDDYGWKANLSTNLLNEKDIINYNEVYSNRFYQKWVERIQLASPITGIGAYRIPTCKHFVNGDLLTCCEGRETTDDDTEACIYMSISRNGIEITGGIFRSVGDGEHKLANPNLVLKDKTMYLFYTVFSASGTPTVDNEIKNYYVYSSDNGTTWSNEVEILPDDQTSSSDLKYLVSPGTSIVHSSGKIIIPFWGKRVLTESDPTWYRSGIIVWDIEGTGTFTKYVNEVATRANEPSIYEDNDANIIIDCRQRSLSVRTVYYTSDMGVTWNLHSSSGRIAVEIYQNILKYGNSLLRVEVDSASSSTTRKDLNLLIGDVDNTDYNTLQEITERDVYVWGYGVVSYYAGELMVVSEDNPNLVLYKVKIFNVEALNLKDTIQKSVSFEYIPNGTTIDTSKLEEEYSNVGDVEITQSTGSIIFTDLTTDSVGSEYSRLTSENNFSFDVSQSDIYIYFKITKTNDSFFQLLLNESVNNLISLRTNDVDSNLLTIKVINNGISIDTTTTETLNGEFKFKIIDGTMTIYKWSGTAYITVDSVSVPNKEYYMQLTRSVATVTGESMSVNQIGVYSEDWSGQIPS